MGNYTSCADIELIDSLLSEKDSKWFAALYDRYAPKVYNKCLYLTHDNEVAKDLTHDVFIKIFLNLGTFKRNAAFSTWIYAITYNLCIDHLRKSKQYNAVPLEDESQTALSDEIDDGELMKIEIERLRILLEKIPTDEKLILLMKYQDEISIHDIGQILSIGESATKMRISRAKKKIIDLYNIKYRHNIY